MGGLATLRIECDFQSVVPPAQSAGATTRRLRFEDTNHRGRVGWHEVVLSSEAGMALFDSSAYGTGITDELKAYPEDMLAAPLNERVAEVSFTRGAIPAGTAPLLTRNGRKVAAARDRLTELIAAPELTVSIALFGLLLAIVLGGLHALSPGHGKTIVAAYLVGSRGTARHAAFLGLTVTITHTAGVFALGLVTLFAAQYILPERLFPIMSLVSGAIVLTIGVSLLFKRLGAALGFTAPAGHTLAHHSHTHDHHEHSHDHSHGHDHSHDHSHDEGTHHHHDAGEPHVHPVDAFAPHSHGGQMHTHLPPGTDGAPVTWRSLLALGISGGLLPCPSALVVLLSAISLHRVGYGLLLVVAFSVGLASVLTGIGLLFVYARRFIERPFASGRLVRVMPVFSALVITCAGAVICYEALGQAGVNFSAGLNVLLLGVGPTLQKGWLASSSVLGLGFALGLKHAVEADHLAAVSAIASERKSILSASLVGGLWGVGHTISLLAAGVVVIMLRIEISEKTALGLEFCVGLMLVGLGINALRKLWRGGRLHFHEHRHGGRTHVHPHIHGEESEAAEAETHHGLRLSSARPLAIGMIHGLAGSAALMLLVLSSISSPLTAFAYIAVFGIGSIGGMMVMSALIGLPLQLTATRFSRANLAVRALAGLFSLGFGLFMVYEIGWVDGLFH